jgi:membrane protein EpsK
LAANIGIGVYYTPFLVHQLGIIAYGVIPLSLIINQYISVITGSLTNAFTRFYSISVQRGEYEKASENISTSLLVIFLIIVVLSPFLFFLVYRIDSIFNIPPELVKGGKYLFFFTIVSFFISLITSLLNVTLYALNRLDLLNVLKIIRSVLKCVLVIVFFSFVKVDIIYVGLSNVLTELLILSISIFLFIKYGNSKIVISMTRFNKSALYTIGGMAVWIIIHQLGDTGLYRIDNLIVNKYWGISESGTLGAISEFGGYIRTMVSVVGTLCGPLILAAYSEQNHEEVKLLAFNQSYIVGSLTAVIAGVVAGYAANVLHVWLGESFSQFGIWLFIKLISVPYYASGGVLIFVVHAWNKVKFPAVATLALGAINLLVIVLAASSGSKSIPVILGISAFFSILQSYFLTGYCINKIFNGSLILLIRAFVKIGIIFILSFLVCSVIQSFFSLNTVVILGFALVTSCLMLFVLVYFLFYTKSMRRQVLALFLK